MTRFALMLGLVAATVPLTSSFAVEAGQKAADFALPTLAGGKVELKELAGKIVLIDFWASWCEPCKAELPELEKLAQKYGPRGVVILGIDVDEKTENGARLAQQLGLHFTIAADPAQKTIEKYDPPRMPSSFVVDRAGVVRFVNAGFDGPKDVVALKRELEQLLAAPLR